MLAWKDLDPGKKGPTPVTWGLIGFNTLVFLVTAAAGSDPGRYGATPSHLNLGGLFLAPFMHGGFLHLAGNMYFLFIFGRVVEPAMGGGIFLFLYLFFGLFAGLCDILARLGSPIPAIGASGAIMGVMALCAALFPNKRFAVFSYTQRGASMSAAGLVGYYVFFDVVYGLLSMVGSPDGIGHFAHLGGAAAGLAFGLLLRATGSAD